MSTITLRSTKGTPLTNNEIDGNFTNLNTDKLEITDTTENNTANKVVKRDSNGDFAARSVTLSGTLTAATITETSSITLKENINPIENALNCILQLNGVTYDRKDGTTKKEAGLIAEDVFKTLPNLVSLNKGGSPESISYTKLTAYLIEAIKELKNELDLLKGKQ